MRLPFTMNDVTIYDVKPLPRLNEMMLIIISAYLHSRLLKSLINDEHFCSSRHRKSAKPIHRTTKLTILILSTSRDLKLYSPDWSCWRQFLSSRLAGRTSWRSCSTLPPTSTNTWCRCGTRGSRFSCIILKLTPTSAKELLMPGFRYMFIK